MLQNIYTVGVCGFAGTGKTTFLNLLQNLSPNIIIFDLDHLVFKSRIKRKDEIITKIGHWYFNDDGFLTEKTLIELAKAPIGTLTEIHKIISEDVLYGIYKMISTSNLTEINHLALGYTMIPAFNFWNNIDYKVLITTDFDKRKEKLKQRATLSYGEQLQVVDNANNECYNDAKFNRIISHTYNHDYLKSEAEKLLREIIIKELK